MLRNIYISDFLVVSKNLEKTYNSVEQFAKFQSW